MVEQCGRLLVGQGDDTYDPICIRPRGHSGLCAPSSPSGQAPPEARRWTIWVHKLGAVMGVSPAGQRADEWEPVSVVEVPAPGVSQPPARAGDVTDDLKFALATVIRDWIHETPFSKCNEGVDECLDWPLAFALRDRLLPVLARAGEAPSEEEQERIAIDLLDQYMLGETRAIRRMRARGAWRALSAAFAKGEADG